MTGDQWYNVIRLALCLGFLAFFMYGLYRLVSEVNRKANDDNDNDNGT